VNVNNEKMSKSKNNFFTVRDLSKVYGYLPLRYFAVSAHYRSPINYEPGIIEQAKASLERINNCLANLKFLAKNAADTELNAEQAEYLNSFISYRNRFEEAMDDDLNSPIVISHLFDSARAINTVFDGKGTISEADLEELRAVWKTYAMDILGLQLRGAEGLLNSSTPELLNSYKGAVDMLLNMRLEAKRNKDWGTSDKIRNELTALGFTIKDTKDGFEWSL
jgi:cysteinyl-tRNA synthetase